MFTLLQLQNAALHACGRSTIKAGNSTLIMVNMAIDEIATSHPWIWRYKSTTLDYVISQSYIALPSDFEALRYLRGGLNLHNSVIPTSLDRIYILRQTPNISANLSVFYAVVSTPQSGVTTQPPYRLEIFPTPAANQTAALQLDYLRNVPDLANGTDVADMPDQLSAVLLMMVRGYAELMELNNPGGCWAVAHQMLEEAKLRDTMTQPIQGRLRGTVEEVSQPCNDSKWRFYTDTPVNI